MHRTKLIKSLITKYRREAMIYHVSKSGKDSNAGTKESPFLTVNAAARIAKAGDTVVVHEGEYREWIKPRYGGLSNNRRITYEAAEGENVVIKGSERIQTWTNVEKGIWKAELPNAMFGDHNPYEKTVVGDWLLVPEDRYVHLGDVYLNGMSFYEAENLEALKKPETRTEIADNWTQIANPILNPEQTKYLWYATVGDKNTTIYANFHEADPNKELVEVNVRRSCFYPEKTGLDYITVRGFEMAQAATPWTPPTADQPGLIGPNWSKGWIIENCMIHDSKCSAISIGKEISTGHNFRTFRRDKSGYQYQLESVFKAYKIGWSKENIGSHIIRNNVIYDCGQNGIVGHLGCVFSEIYNNHIYNIALKREFYGHEIGGIKLHAAIDVHIHHNHIHDCSLGLWLDWQAQGARVSKNLFHRNSRDLFIEVSHGPFVVDHNIFGSDFSLLSFAQGSAYIGNLIAGKTELHKVPDRATPYHAPHSTDVAGYALVYAGDDRVYQNIFTGTSPTGTAGTSGYDGYTTSLEEYIEKVKALGRGDHDIFIEVEQPVYISDNVYFNGAEAFEKEAEKLVMPDFDTEFELEFVGEEVFLNITLPKDFESQKSDPHSTKSLHRVRIVDVDFDNPDGTMLILDSDYLDTLTGAKVNPGPLSCLKSGKNRVKVW